MPFIYKQFLVLLIQQPDKITFYYNGNGDIRHVRLNEPHRTPQAPPILCQLPGALSNGPFATV
jgi:hypothetical protein